MKTIKLKEDTSGNFDVFIDGDLLNTWSSYDNAELHVEQISHTLDDVVIELKGVAPESFYISGGKWYRN